MPLSCDETTALGLELAHRLGGLPPAGQRFTDMVIWARIDVDDDSHEHLIDPEHVLNFAMARY
jgi:hypothetical protein